MRAFAHAALVALALVLVVAPAPPAVADDPEYCAVVDPNATPPVYVQTEHCEIPPDPEPAP